MVLILLLLLIIKYSIGDHCTYITSVDITDGERFENGTFEYNGTQYPVDQYISYENTTRGCVCKNVDCYRKCCGRDEIYRERSLECVDRSSISVSSEDNETMFNLLEELEQFEKQHNLRQINSFKELNRCDKEFCLVRTDSYKSHRLTEKGTLLVENVDGPDYEVGVDQYCIDVMIYTSEKTNELTLGREAYFQDRVSKKVDEYVQNYITMIISAVFILLTIIVYVILPDLKNSLHGRNLLCHLCSMLVSFTFLATMQISGSINAPTRNFCVIFSFIIYFSFLASFFWLNVMCFDMWKKFRYTRAIVAGDLERKFRNYCLYAFGIPAFLTVLLAVLEFTPIEDHTLLPRLRRRECFLSGNGKLIYLYSPISIICIANMVLFVLTTSQIVKTAKKTSKHLNSEDSKKSKAKDKQRFLTYVKLFIVMGISWILEVVSFILPDVHVIWKITDAFNALSGFFIFIIVICNKEKFTALKKRFREVFHIPDKMGSTITLNTDLSQNVIKNSENLEKRRETGKNIHQKVGNSETNQSSSTNKTHETHSSLSHKDRMNENFDDSECELLHDQESKNNATPIEENSSEILNESVGQICENCEQDNLRNQGKTDKLEPTNGEKSIEKNLNKTYNSNQEIDHSAFEEDKFINKSRKEEKDSKSEDNSKTTEIQKINKEDVLRENENSNIMYKDNRNQNGLKNYNNKMIPYESLQQASNNLEAGEENAFGTQEKVNTVQEHQKEDFNA